MALKDHLTRRSFLLSVPSAGLLAGCSSLGNGVGNSNAAEIDARVDKTRDYMLATYPSTRDLRAKAKGILYMPLVTEAGFIFLGGSYGRGALRINGATVDYYSATSASVGLQLGAQQYAHVLFFLTDAALADFRRSSGWVAGANIRYATPDQGATLSKDTTEMQQPVVAYIFGQQGLIVGASLQGTKYTRIIP